MTKRNHLSRVKYFLVINLFFKTIRPKSIPHQFVPHDITQKIERKNTHHKSQRYFSLITIRSVSTTKYVLRDFGSFYVIEGN